MTTPGGTAAPGAPRLGTAGSFMLNGQMVHVNTRGIIDTQGPLYGQYPQAVLTATAGGSSPFKGSGPEAVQGDPTGLPYQSPQAPTLPAPPDPAIAAAERQRQADEQAAAAVTEETNKRNRDSYARLNTVLADYGLGTLGASVQSWLVEGLSESEITQRMRDTNEFKTRFPAIAERTKKGLSPISPGEYVAYERNARQMMRAAGLPEGFYDSPEDFSKFLNNDLSIAELGDRVTLAANAAFKMPKEDRDALARFGAGPGDITAFWLNPDTAQPLLERKYAAAQLAGSAQRTTYGQLDETTASGLADLNVTAQQAEQGFGELANSRELFGALDSGEDVIDQDAQLDAQFRGSAAARRRIEQRAKRRTATFEAGGGFASAQGGITGLGDTDG